MTLGFCGVNCTEERRQNRSIGNVNIFLIFLLLGNIARFEKEENMRKKEDKKENYKDTEKKRRERKEIWKNRRTETGWKVKKEGEGTQSLDYFTLKYFETKSVGS
jgi:hypothetical protein